MKIVIGADHGGFELKEFLKNERQDIDWLDIGTFSEESCDYPLIADKLVDVINSGQADFGVLICGTGIGISIAANRHKGIRAAILYNKDVASLTREHNDANVAVFGARTQSKENVLAYLDVFLTTPFSNGERHCRRIAELG
ncbi:MAG: RpiB/LacA/LacB family sugar-phosphate isomerase [Alphaproteobacteria bacterium]|nr:RpiB/LacA/LacB family sugar-phosphate isomerase [Alphaproteobacteria bacterium]MBE6467357.1 RpiB/LacA/LacB family sugar-phosphate isomerase [Alphaproteobacteria bacterium]